MYYEGVGGGVGLGFSDGVVGDVYLSFGAVMSEKLRCGGMSGVVVCSEPVRS